nr:hypothetical protein [Angustibacter aerolatus]
MRREGSQGTHQARSERDSFAQQARACGWPSCAPSRTAWCSAGSTSAPASSTTSAASGSATSGRTSLLVDWRAPVAAPFYQATPAHPGDVVRRRHLTTVDRTVVGMDDEVLDLEAIDDVERSSLQGEGALMAAVRAPRTGRMGDIVATIQSEQDRIVRDEPGRRAGRAGRPGHRQDRRRAAPRGLPALHPPAAARAQRRARRRPRPAVPALHRAGAALARRERRRHGHARHALPGRRGQPRRRAAPGDAQGRPADGAGAAAGRHRPAEAARRRPHLQGRLAHRDADPRGRRRLALASTQHRAAAQRGPRDVREGRAPAPRAAGSRSRCGTRLDDDLRAEARCRPAQHPGRARAGSTCCGCR